MRPLSAGELLQVWEWGRNRHPVDRALVIVTAAAPDLGWDELTHLSLSQRDSRLLAVRRSIFGPKLSAYAVCPNCAEELEFELDTDSLPTAAPDPGEQTWASQGLEITYRFPNSLDLAVIAQADSVESARAMLLERIIVQIQARQDQQAKPALTAAELDPEVCTALQDHILAQEPLLEILLELTCPACENQWPVLFDIVSFFWTEIASQAKRLLGEVHILDV